MLLIGCLLALIWGGIWAVFLQCHPLGQFLAVKRAWIAVAIGVGVDLLILRLFLPWTLWWPVLAIIGLSSVPVIARSLINEQLEDEEMLDVLENTAGQ